MMRWVLVTLLVLNLIYGVWCLLALPQPKANRVESLSVTKIDATVADLKLLDEVGVSTERRVNTASLSADTGPCTKVGPFKSRAAVSLFVERSGDQGAPRGVIEVEDGPLSNVSWVMVPPYKTLEEAKQMVVVLQADHIESLVITEGKFVNGVSLAMFRDHDEAIKLRDRLLIYGYNVVVESISKRSAKFWAVFDENVDVDMLREKVRVELEDPEQIFFSESGCKKFATDQ